MLNSLAKKHELEIFCDSNLLDKISLPKDLSSAVTLTPFHYVEPPWLLNLFHLIWLDEQKRNVSFKTKFIREFVGDLRIWQPRTPSCRRTHFAVQRILEIASRLIQPKFILALFPLTRKIGIAVLKRSLSNYRLESFPDFSRHKLVVFPSIGYEPGTWLLFRAISKQGSKSLVSIDNWDNISSKSIYIVKPDYISVPGPLSSVVAENLHGFSRGQILEWGMPKFDILMESLPASDKLHNLLYVGYSQPHGEHESLTVIKEELKETDVDIAYRPHPLRKHTFQTEGKQLPASIQLRGKRDQDLTLTGGHPPLDSRYTDDLDWADLIVGPPTTLLLEAMFAGKPVIVDATKDLFHLSSGYFALHGYTHMQELQTVENLRIAENYSELQGVIREALVGLGGFPRGRSSVRAIVSQETSYLDSFTRFLDRLNS